MGGGSRSTHQHHSVDTGLGGTSTAEELSSSTAAGEGDAERAAQDGLPGGAQTRCPRCGQFASMPDLSDHTCPMDTTERRVYRDDFGVISMPDASHLQGAIEPGMPVTIPVEATIDDPISSAGVGSVQGEVDLDSNGNVDSNRISEGLTCSCGEPGCQHARLAAASVADRMSARDGRTSQRRATTAVLDALGVEHTASQEALQNSQDAWPVETASYLDNPEAFQTAYQAARDRIDQDLPPVPLQFGDATGGLGARDGGRGFGVELEFDFPNGVDRYSALRSIAQELHAEGLSEHTAMVGYHSGRAGGYSDARNAWRLESDATVAGEIVSPILYDGDQTWRDLSTVCGIVRRHGGAVTRRTGGHVHVSAGNYDHTVDHHNRLLRLSQSYSDTLFRLASNPERGRHRGTQWCSPNYMPSSGYESVTHARNSNGSHGLALNLESMRGRSSDHVEFRMWDASLDPGVIQTQVKLSLGLTEAAFRDTRSNINGGEDHQIGHHHARYGGRGRGARLSGDEWRDSTRSFRSFVDTIFHRDQDKAQATALFAATRWQRR